MLTNRKKIIPSALIRPLLYLQIVAVISFGTAAVALENQNPAQNSSELVESGAKAAVKWTKGVWELGLNPTTGALCKISNREDAEAMNWVHDPLPPAKGAPTPSPEARLLDSGPWGLIRYRQKVCTKPVALKQVSPDSWQIAYQFPDLNVDVLRALEGGELTETYTFTNPGSQPLTVPSGQLGILAPLFDEYNDAQTCNGKRCNVHLWMGHNVSWINAMRMGGKSPHLGLILSAGELDSYSIAPRRWTSNDRGTFVVHPPALTLAPGGTYRISWRLFWHQGWESFWQRAYQTPGFIQMTVRRYSVPVGQPVELSIDAAQSLDGAVLLADGVEFPLTGTGSHRKASIPTKNPGDLRVELRQAKASTWLRALVTPDPMKLIEARARFIVEHQQRQSPGDKLDGALLAYDNQTNSQFYSDKDNDTNAGRERVGMGVLLAQYFPLCKDASLKAAIKTALDKYDAFIARELQDANGTVFNDVGRRGGFRRGYNYPWIAHFHVAMYQADGRKEHLDNLHRTLRSFYEKGGAANYVIGLPIPEILAVFEKAGMSKERADALGWFRKHADTIQQNGTNFPRCEVNYEQSIVGPAVQILLETYQATDDVKYLDAARALLLPLEAFAGQQPDYHLNEISIRHWDDYWFGERSSRTYGDTFPHYWSTINSVVFDRWAAITKNPAYADRADRILAQNFCEFFPDGRGSCAYVYPQEIVDGGGKRHPGQFADPFANDQDWTLVNYLLIQARRQ